MSDAEIIRQLIKDMTHLKEEQARLASMVPLFEVSNHNTTPIVLSTDQNNYDPGNYDHILINNGANINISGIAGGVSGRILYITTQGAGSSVSYLHFSASSIAVNRIITISGATVAKTNRQTMVLRYSYNLTVPGMVWLQIV